MESKPNKYIGDIVREKVSRDLRDSGELLYFYPVQYWAGYKKGYGATVNTKGLTKDEQMLMTIQVYKFFLDGVKQGNYYPFTDDDGDNDVRQVIDKINGLVYDEFNISYVNVLDIENTEIFEKLLRKEK